MGVGKEFENRLMDALEDWVGDDGVPMIRRQQQAMRRGKFQAAQEVDIFVDSPTADYYIGIEAKSRDASSKKGRYGFYLSGLNPGQFKGQQAYATKSGRDVIVACEARNWHGGDDYAYLVPLDLFIQREKRNDVKVSWDDIVYYGAFIGRNGEYVIRRDDIESVLNTGEILSADPDRLDAEISVSEDEVMAADTAMEPDSGDWSVQ